MELQELYKKTYFLEDPAVLPLIISIVIGSKFQAPPVWLYVIGPTSGGKTTLLSVLNKVPFVSLVSDITANTFLSGASSKTNETSLLRRLGDNFVMVMKDFTTILSKSPETQETIIGQMREIYDGHFKKDTGLGVAIEWGTKEKPAKATMLMASTESIYKVQEKFSDMGTRAISYILKEQDGKKTTKMALRKNNTSEAEMAHIQQMVSDFVMAKVYKAEDKPLPILDESIEDAIIDVAEFSERCRSMVMRDYKGEKSLALSAGLPMRMAKQMLSIGQFMMYANDGVLTPELLHAIYKTGIDSIPKQRRIVLEVLAKYPRVQIQGVSNEINYPPKFTRSWIEDLGMFGVCQQMHFGNKEYWTLKPEYREIMQKHAGVKTLNFDLEGDSDTSMVGYSYGSDEVDRGWAEQENTASTAKKAEDDFNKF